MTTRAYGAIIDNIVLRICNAGSCSGAPLYMEDTPFESEAFQDFLQPFQQQFGRIRIGRLPPGAFE